VVVKNKELVSFVLTNIPLEKHGAKSRGSNYREWVSYTSDRLG
jgi:hypothetical protein